MHVFVIRLHCAIPAPSPLAPPQQATATFLGQQADTTKDIGFDIDDGHFVDGERLAIESGAERRARKRLDAETAGARGSARLSLGGHHGRSFTIFMPCHPECFGNNRIHFAEVVATSCDASSVFLAKTRRHSEGRILAQNRSPLGIFPLKACPLPLLRYSDQTGAGVDLLKTSITPPNELGLGISYWEHLE